MCTPVVVNGKTCNTQGQLANAIDVELAALPLARDYDGSARARELCLCPIDTDAVAVSLRKKLVATWDAQHFVDVSPIESMEY